MMRLISEQPLLSPLRPARAPRLRSRHLAPLLPAVVAAALVFGPATAVAAEASADLVLYNARVLTMDPALPRAQAVAIRGNSILAVGDSRLALGLVGPDTQVLNLHGQTVLPGFHDSHSHLVLGGVEAGQCSLMGLAPLNTLLAAVAACVAAAPADAWVVGGGWELSLFPAGNADKALLDRISSTVPIYLVGADGHSGWANSAALARAGINSATADPKGGRIERYPNSREPSGTLREAAQQLLQVHLPEVTPAQQLAGLRRGQALAHSLGITSAVEAAATPVVLAAYQQLRDQGELALRIRASVLVSGDLAYGPAPELLRPADRGQRGLLRADAAKIFVDGVLEGETAALLEPYLDAQGPVSGHLGELVQPPADLAAMVTDLDARGIQVHMHAIGDRAVRVALDAVASARAHNGNSGNRHHIAHLQLIHPDDCPRFAELNVSANMQMLWAYPDAYITDINLPAVGPERVQRMYPFACLAAAGAHLAAGSDWNVSSMDPLPAMATAMTRSDPAGATPGVLNPDQALSLQQVLRAYTLGGAELMHQNHLTGSLTPGKRADLVVLDRAIPDTSAGTAAAALAQAKVALTLFDGQPVYQLEDTNQGR